LLLVIQTLWDHCSIRRCGGRGLRSERGKAAAPDGLHVAAFILLERSAFSRWPIRGKRERDQAYAISLWW
jgi:hypothetical protein